MADSRSQFAEVLHGLQSAACHLPIHDSRFTIHVRHPRSANRELLNFATMRILMVCLGNICRSPLAEGILQHKAWQAGLNWSVESAGTNGYHTGEPPHKLSQKVAKLNGLDICNQRSRKFVGEDFQRFDMIYAMSADVIEEMQLIAGKKFEKAKVKLLMDEMYPDQNVDVPDPWYGPEPGYHEVFEMISKACDRIVEKYAAKVKFSE